MNNGFLGTTVILPVKSVRETTKFYESMLGFDITGIWKVSDKGAEYGSVRRGDVIIEFGEGRKKYSGSGVCLIHVDNADEIYSEFKSKGVEVVGDLSDRDYGNRDFRVKDNNGNILIISHSLNNQNELLQTNKVA
ncbi:MAG: VOC family protein [gamma proteobacterium endosymbiont of Lamellibrachia anaximandri]|nr:VOC family protein [gamma proteobacterium endosymbiont of Lamellibrachia anaximandri]MBL3535837.1 VOC family protein [gamma proteobacterium endosymbiont of Lamellibrachia anaximandri]